MDKINDLLNKRINKVGLQKPLEAAMIVSCANEVADHHFQAIKYFRGILTIACESGEVAHQIFVEQEKYVQQINSKLNHPYIKRLAFRIGKHQ
jgi:hypothetical protein